MAVEQVARWPWNAWPDESGLGGRMAWNPQRERIRRKIYATRDEARSDIFDYIEMFYNPKRRHSSAMQLSPVEYEKRYFLSLESV